MDGREKVWVRRAKLFVGIFLAANLLYAAKSLAGIDLLPGHSGDLFPAGRELFFAFR